VSTFAQPESDRGDVTSRATAALTQFGQSPYFDSDLCESAKEGTPFPHRCVNRSHDATPETADNQTQQLVLGDHPRTNLQPFADP